jgi:hypothetical protein
MTQITSDLFSPVYFMFGLGLVLAPWLLADRRIGMREALPQSWRTARERATDLLTFTLRYVVLFAAARWLTGFTRTGQWDAEPSVAGLTGRLLHSAAWLMAVLVIGVLYQHLKDARTEVIEPQPDPTEAT